MYDVNHVLHQTNNSYGFAQKLEAYCVEMAYAIQHLKDRAGAVELVILCLFSTLQCNWCQLLELVKEAL